jgi:tetratricopeptide (TPR) repeat protein
MRRHNIITLLFCLWAGSAQGQQDWKSLSTDERFVLARKKAFDGKREEAREMLNSILEKSPDYHDVRILLARTYAWDGQRENARKELRYVLEHEPRNEDAISALVDNETWDNKLEDALATANTGLKYYPNSEDFLYKKSSLLNSLQRTDEALTVLSQLMAIDPAHEKGAILRSSIKNNKLKYEAGLYFGAAPLTRPNTHRLN